jgi:hypothetical protein
MLEEVDAIGIDTRLMSESRFSDFFFSEVFEALYRWRNGRNHEITIPWHREEVGSTREMMQFGGERDDVEAWRRRGKQLRTGWDFSGRSDSVVTVAPAKLGTSGRRLIAAVLLDYGANAKGLGLDVDFRSERSVQLRVAWRADESAAEGRVGRVHSVGAVCGGWMGELWMEGRTVRTPWVGRLAFQRTGGDFAAIVSVGTWTSATVLLASEGSGKLERRDGWLAFDDEVGGVLSVIRVEVVKVQRVQLVGVQGLVDSERIEARIRDVRWVGVEYDLLLFARRRTDIGSGRRIHLLIKPDELGDLPIGSLREGGEYWVAVGPSAKGWSAVVAAESVGKGR